MICLPSVFLVSHYVWTRPLRELACVQSTAALGMFWAMVDSCGFVLLEKLVFSCIAGSLIKPRFGPFHVSSRRVFKKFPQCVTKHLNVASECVYLLTTICYSGKHPGSPQEFLLLRGWKGQHTCQNTAGSSENDSCGQVSSYSRVNDVLVWGKLTKRSARRSNSDSTLELKKENKRSESYVCSD